jgi:hypothetical protein
MSARRRTSPGNQEAARQSLLSKLNQQHTHSDETDGLHAAVGTILALMAGGQGRFLTQLIDFIGAG